jgi:addiction module RelE/StbE family toxin
VKVVWSPLALERVEEIAEYIAAENVEATRILLIDIFSVVGRLRRFPKSGRTVPEVNRKDIREIIFKKYRIVYRVARQQVSILTVRHGKQRLPREEVE